MLLDTAGLLGYFHCDEPFPAEAVGSNRFMDVETIFSGSDCFTSISRWHPRGWLHWATHPRKTFRALRHAPVSVRFIESAAPGTITRWTYDRDRLGDTLAITFGSFQQLQSLVGRWRVLSDAIQTIGREDSGFTFHDVPIDLGDGVGPSAPTNVLAFARSTGSKAPLIPNPYLLRPRPWILGPRRWERKNDTLYFRGSTTGAPTYDDNKRVALCKLAKTLPRTDCRLSRLKQIDGDFAERLAKDDLVGWRHPLDILNRHRFLAEADGNTSSWDRYLLIGLFGGVPIRFETEWEECWHHLLVDGENCIVADRRSLPAILDRLRSRASQAQAIAENASQLVRNHLSRQALRQRLRNALKPC